MALIERITIGKALPEPVMEKILAQTDGVPLFIEELTKTVLESGLLQEQSGHYVLERPLPSFAIPTTLYASLMARLDRLAAVKEVAQIGAAVGREFSYELLSVVAGLPKEKFDEALDQLVRSELVFCRGEKLERIYTFKHVLVRDAAYAGLLKSRRAELHAAIANAFEQQFPDFDRKLWLTISPRLGSSEKPSITGCAPARKRRPAPPISRPLRTCSAASKPQAGWPMSRIGTRSSLIFSSPWHRV